MTNTLDGWMAACGPMVFGFVLALPGELVGQETVPTEEGVNCPVTANLVRGRPPPPRCRELAPDEWAPLRAALGFLVEPDGEIHPACQDLHARLSRFMDDQRVFLLETNITESGFWVTRPNNERWIAVNRFYLTDPRSRPQLLLVLLHEAAHDVDTDSPDRDNTLHRETRAGVIANRCSTTLDLPNTGGR